MRFRQIHLDFHTSEKISDVGAKFEKKQFAEMLKSANVDSITLFSKCHHGFSYHPTKMGVMHPGLNFNLLKDQIDICREAGIKTPIYISAGYDEYYYQRNPGVAVLYQPPRSPLHIGFMRLCFNTEYLDYLCRQIEEVIDTFDCSDGIFLDIVGVAQCYCRKCINDMIRHGFNPQKPSDVLHFACDVQKNYYQKTLSAVRKNNSSIPVFQNAGHIRKGNREFLKYVSHLELESLPTGGWGYDHFPASARYAGTLQVEYLGMTGKFHTTWGEFGGFKHPNALIYETSLMLAHGAKCSIGDQLHPRGDLNCDTYKRIGLAYSDVAKKEPFCTDTKAVSEIALLSVESLKYKLFGNSEENDQSRNFDADTGAQRMMLERQIMFDVIDEQTDFSPYRAIIVPDDRCLDQQTSTKLQKYIDTGGKLILSYQSGLRLDSDKMYFDFAKYLGTGEFQPEYLQIQQQILSMDKTGNLVSSPFVFYGSSINMKTEGLICANRLKPYFNRTIEQFCSHQHAPDDAALSYPAVIIKDNICYFAGNIFTSYAHRGQLLYRDLFYTILDKFIDGLMFYSNMPAAGIATLRSQPSMNRDILHLLYASPIKRGNNVMPWRNIKHIEVIEDIVKLAGIKCSVRLQSKPKSINIAITNQPVTFEWKNNRADFIVPEIYCHQILTINY